MGYNETSKVYQIYIPSSRNILVRWDAKFLEDKAFRKSHEISFEEQDEDAPLVQQLGSDLARRQAFGSSTVTSTNISSREEESGVSQQV